jgi:hypothetical protein
MLENMALRKILYLDPREWNQQNGENYTPRNFRIVLRQVLLR